MLKAPRIVREAARTVAEAVNRTATSNQRGQIVQEPDFTSRMVARIEDAVNGSELKGVEWSAHVLSDRGPGAAERTYGADFLGVLSVDLNGFSLRKGFLAQAKLLRHGSLLSRAEWNRLKEQCDRMLALSPDSYVFAYSLQTVRIIPAVSVMAADHQPLANLYDRSVAAFFLLHFESFIGDRQFGTASESELRRARRRAEARTALLLQLKGIMVQEGNR